MEYWKEITGIIGGLIVIGKLIQMSRIVVTKTELKDIFIERDKQIALLIENAVLKGLTRWQQQNGIRIEKR